MFSLPYAGYIFAVLGVKQFRMALIGAPALLVALWIVIGMWRDAGEIVRRRERGVAWTSVSASRTPNLGPARAGATATGSGAVALPITWGLPAERRHGPAPAVHNGELVPLRFRSRPRGRAGRVEVPIVLPARLRAAILAPPG